MAAIDLRWGRQGGRRLPLRSDWAQEADFWAAIARGEVVYAECLCTYWFLAARDVGEPCGHCGVPTIAVDVDLRSTG